MEHTSIIKAKNKLSKIIPLLVQTRILFTLIAQKYKDKYCNNF